MTIFDSLLFLYLHYFGVRVLELFFAFLLTVMAITFWTNMVASKPDITEILYGTFVPSIPEHGLSAATATVGAVIMPHVLFLHSALVLSRKVDTRCNRDVKEACIYNNIESAISLTMSFLISMSVIVTFAVYIIEHPEGDKGMDLYMASEALHDLLGTKCKYVWAVGLLAAGQSSTMTGTYAGQFVMEGFLDIKLPIWQRVVVTRSVAIVPAIIVTFMNDDNLIKFDYLLNVTMSVLLPFALTPLCKFVSSPELMGEFAVSSTTLFFLATFGFGLFLMNFMLLFEDTDSWSNK